MLDAGDVLGWLECFQPSQEKSGRTLEHARQLAGHASPKTTTFYDSARGLQGRFDTDDLLGRDLL